MRVYRRPSARAVRSLLTAANLPSSDLADDMEHFFGCGSRTHPEGVVGLEVYGSDALLRSLVVSPAARGKGYGKALVAAVEQHARDAGMRRVFLLTDTAEAFFASLGYASLPRDLAPQDVRNSREFASLCPASAAFMCKELE